MMTRRSGCLRATTPTRGVTTIHGGKSLSQADGGDREDER